MISFMLAMYIAMASNVRVPVGVQVIAWVLTVVWIIGNLVKACLED